MKKNPVSETSGLPLLLLFAEELKTEDITKQLEVGSQRLAVDMTTWETNENQDP